MSNGDIHINQKMRIYGNVSDLIGNTPMIKLNRVVESGMAEILVKLESFNPGGSVKDRICLSMINDAENRGLLKSGGTIVEPTSGNTGIGLAMIGADRSYRVMLTMPETMSQERIHILKSYGAEVVLTPGSDGMSGAIKKAEEIAANTNAFMPQQFKNPANPEIHRKTTAVEILKSTNGRVDAFVTGVGTGGTITGVGEVLKNKNPLVKIVAVEPAASPVLSGGQPGPHKIQGIGAGFVPDVLNVKIIGEIVKVTDIEAYQTAKRLSKEEGILVGFSSGAACFAALKIARDLGEGKVVVTLFPDTGERYLSMEQFFAS
jgi:cysteine synthase A